MSALLERERELASLQARLAEVHAGSGGLVLIEAPAGLGKTRLLEAVRDNETRAGICALAARATELERDFPFAIVRQLFQAQLVAMAAPERDVLLEEAGGAARGALGLPEDDPPAQRDDFAVLHALYWLTAALAERSPLLLIVDDAHWSDAASLQYLAFLLPRLEELPVLLVLARRPGETEQNCTLARIATDPLAQRLAPGPLSRGAATELLNAELGVKPDEAFTAAAYEVSGGNPFLLCELLRTLTEQGVRPGAEQARLVWQLAPERVTATVGLRLERLSAQARTVARALAVLGDNAEPRLLAALAELDAGTATKSADELRGIEIFDRDVQLRFIHPLVRNVLYSEIPAGERTAAHRRAAALLDAQGSSPEQVALHLLATDGRGERDVVETLREAAARALARGAPQSAVAYLDRALREPPSGDLRAAVIQPLITASVHCGDRSTLSSILTEVNAELERSPRMLVSCAADLATWLVTGHPDEATELLERAIEAATNEDDIDSALSLEAQLIVLAQLPPGVARSRLQRYRDRVAADSPSERLMMALDALLECMGGGSATAASRLARRAFHEGKIFAEQPGAIAPRLAVVALITADALDDAQQIVESLLLRAERRGSTAGEMLAFYLRGRVALALGNLPAAEAGAARAVNLARLRGNLAGRPPLTALVVDVMIERDELQAAEDELLAHGLGATIPDTIWFAPLLLSRGRLRLAQNRPKQAAQDLIELQQRMERWAMSESLDPQVGSYAVLALTALGQRERAREIAERDVVDAKRWGAPSKISQALCGLGLAIGGQPGIRLLHEAVDVLNDSPACLQRAHALADLGAALRRSNRRSQARQPLREALELARRCGAIALARRTYDELQATGEKVPRYTPIGVESLTVSERRVADMAASGMTNRQIAQALFVTVKTIETHLSAAYDKLGIRTRHQLTDALLGPADQSPGAEGTASRDHAELAELTAGGSGPEKATARGSVSSMRVY